MAGSLYQRDFTFLVPLYVLLVLRIYDFSVTQLAYCSAAKFISLLLLLLLRNFHLQLIQIAYFDEDKVVGINMDRVVAEGEEEVREERALYRSCLPLEIPCVSCLLFNKIARELEIKRKLTNEGIARHVT